MMKSRLFWITFIAANVSLLLYGGLALMMPNILLEPFSAHVYRFPDDATSATAYLAALFRLLGFFNLILGTLGLLILHRYRVTGQEWHLKIVIVSTVLAYMGPIVFDNTVGTIGVFEIVEHILFVLVVILGFVVMSNADTINRLGATRIGVWAIKHLISPFQRWVYRATGGRVLSNIGTDRNVLLLTTKGRRTGKDRTTPVFYLRDGEAIVICNVRPEFERTNPWVINLRSHPVARLQIGRDTAQYQAREATDNEVNRLWPRLIKLWPAFQAHYERGGRRSIFILESA